SFRSATALIFMFGVPLLVTGMFYFMFGNIASQGEFNLPRTSVVVANLDQDAPRLQTGSGDVPGGIEANTLSELVLEVLRSEDMEELLEVSIAQDAQSARAAVDNQQAQVAVIIPAGFSRGFADMYGQSTIEFYQDPTLTIGPGIVKSILSQFMDGLSGVKIAVDVFMNQTDQVDSAIIGQAIQLYLANSPTQSENLSEELLDVNVPGDVQVSVNPLVRIIGPIMGGMMIFYAFFTGTTSAQTILQEEEQHTLQRLFTTPTAQSTILSGKFLAVFLTVFVQMTVLLILARLIFRIEWGNLVSVILFTLGVVCVAASFGIFINSMLKSTKQGGIIFGGVLTFTGMVGMISIFAINSPTAARLGNSVSLLVPQGWAVRGLLQAMNAQPVMDVLMTTLVMLTWSVVFFVIGIWRFNKRYS
ncbi:MAG: ABC transporter permease, partial [Anaerolineales bacterium]|nr:ABC transporter permease [Anaerolineales bacterium]